MNNLSKAKEIWETIEKNEPSVELAKVNLAASTKSTPKYTYYYYYYYDVSVDVKVPVPVLFDDMFEPLQEQVNRTLNMFKRINNY
jgi:hypothetical protein